MGAQRIQYNIIGRYINESDARDVVGYHLQSIDNSKSGRYTVEQTAFLVGRGQILNCTVQLYKDKVMFRGKGVSLDSLPMQRIAIGKNGIKESRTLRGASSGNKVGASSNSAGNRASVGNRVGVGVEGAGGKGSVQTKNLTGIEIFNTLKQVITEYGLGKPAHMTITFGEATQEPYFKITQDIDKSEENNYRTHFEFIIDASKNDYYYLRQVEYPNDFVIRGHKNEGLKKFLIKAVPFTGIVHRVSYESIPDLYSEETKSISNAFEAYSGNSFQIEGPLRGEYNGDCGVDKSLLTVSFVHTLTMIMKYKLLKDKNKLGMPVFRGDRRELSKLPSVNNGKCFDSFVSFSYCATIASEFANQGILLYVEEAPLNCLINIEDIAIIREEYEVLANMGIGMQLGECIGKLNGASIYKAKIHQEWDYKQCVKYMLSRYKPIIEKSLLMYTVYKLSMCVKHPRQFEFTGISYDGLKIYNFYNNSKNVHIALDIGLQSVVEIQECQVTIDDTEELVIRNRSEVDDLVEHLIERQ